MRCNAWWSASSPSWSGCPDWPTAGRSPPPASTASSYYGVYAAVGWRSRPEVKFKIEARIGFFGSLTAQGPSAISGTQPASTFIENQAKKAGFLFENQGVSTQLKNCVFTGSPIEQAKQAAKQIGAELVIDDQKIIMIPNGGSVKGTVPVLSSTSGLIGYPVMTQNGIECKAIFNPDLNKKSDVKNASKSLFSLRFA